MTFKFYSIFGFARRLGRLVALAVIVSFAAGAVHAAQVSAVGGGDEASREEDQKRLVWQMAVESIPLPPEGCFESTYPEVSWKEVSCIEAPPIPMVPREGPRPFVVGGGNDISARAPSGLISSATGSFTITGVTSESGRIGNSGNPVANAYSLQINTDFLVSTACNPSPNPNCRGWEQFVHFNDGSSGSVFIQYWLIQYNTTCPNGWTQFTFSGGTTIYCYRNSQAAAVPNQPITNLGQLRLTGQANATGDRVTLTTATGSYSVAGTNSVNAAGAWRDAEFNVFGPGGNSSGASQAAFNNGASITTRTQITYGGDAQPNCAAMGYTGETNNLNFGPNAPAGTPPGPALLFIESTAGGATSNCAAAAGVGDTHLTTFSGLLYDFQAAGDFVLADSSDFVVETRQVSGAPVWPNASVNQAVATRMGTSEVAVCLPGQLVVDGNSVDLPDGKSIAVGEDVAVWRMGNVYVVTNQHGDSIRAQVNPGWIDVSVGLGEWPSKVRGLLANPDGNLHQLETSDGAILTQPVSFDDLYNRYGDSWRVKPDDSLLSKCGYGGLVEEQNPQKPFHARDLDPKIYENSLGICLAAGVKEGPLLDACIMDVAVLGKEVAAEVFAKASAPMAVAVVP